MIKRLYFYSVTFFYFMTPKEILQKWVECFNRYDYDGLGELYAENCINHQTPNGITEGKANIKNMFKDEFTILKFPKDYQVGWLSEINRKRNQYDKDVFLCRCNWPS